MTLELAEIATPELVTETVPRSSRLDVRLVGSGEPATVADLAAYLEAIHRGALGARLAEVVVDLRELEFLSAACLRPLLAWFAEVRRARAYVVRLLPDEKKPWQARTLEGLASCAGDVVSIG